jgi:adenine-specific DNA-methyltransferase
MQGLPAAEDPAFLSSQLITCLGNKRALLDLIGEGVEKASARLGGRRLSALDAFSGSGVVSRFFKRYSKQLYVNDIEDYARIASDCFLANRSAFPSAEFAEARAFLERRLSEPLVDGGIVARLYAPIDDEDIRPGERVFYTRRNARYLDTARLAIGELPGYLQPFFLGPLISEASVHANTSGVFKGFYKDPGTGLGRFGGRKGDALSRIKGEISLAPPVLSRHECDVFVLQGDANSLGGRLPGLDLAYLDPPYNQHPYGSNYFMLNLLAKYEEPRAISRVSGIPHDWRRSDYNRAGAAAARLGELVAGLDAKFVLVSFNSEGFIGQGEMEAILGREGKVEILERKYNAFRGSRNLGGRGLHVREYLYILEKN